MTPERMREIAGRAGAKTARDTSEVLATALAAEVAPRLEGRRLAIDLHGVTDGDAELGSFRVTVERIQ